MNSQENKQPEEGTFIISFPIVPIIQKEATKETTRKFLDTSIELLKNTMENKTTRIGKAWIVDVKTRKILKEATATLNGYFIDNMDGTPKNYIKYNRA